MDKVTIGQRIKKQRKKLKLTLEQFSEKVGISRNYLAEIESGRKLPSLNTFILIINNLNMSSDEILKTEVIRARPYVENEIVCMTKNLKPQQFKIVLDVIEALIKNIENIDQGQNH